MEQRRLEIARKTSDIARKYIADIIKDSVVDLRGEYPNEIIEVVNNLSFDHSHIPDVTFNEGDLFREQTVNNLLELIYLDLLIQYGDIFDIQDRLTDIRKLFDSSISANVVKASELADKARSYKALSSKQFQFTDTYHESFNMARNHSLSDFKLGINNGAGLIRLPSIVEEFARPETSEILLTVFSDATKLVDESDDTGAYTDDLTEPYFVTVFSTGNPVNKDVPAVLLADYNGIIVDITVRFNTVVPVTRVNFTPFSSAPLDLVGVFYSVVPEASWDYGDIRIVRQWDLAYDTDDIEVNFPRVYAREIHILVHQTSFNLARADTEIEDVLSAKDYIDAVADNISYLLPEGFTEHNDLEMQVEELTKYLQDKATIQTERPAPNTRSYVVGLCGIGVSNVSYSHFGDYHGATKSIKGNLHSISFIQDGDITRSGGEGVVDSCALFSIQTGGSDIYVGSVDDSGKAIDAAVIEANLEYREGAMVKNDTHPYKFETHFRPTDTMSGLEMYNDGKLYTFPAGAQIELGIHNAIVKLPASFATLNNLLEGTIITMLYDLNSYDQIGRPYNVSQVRLSDRIGRPNIAVNEAVYIKDSYLYVPTISGSVEYAPELSVTEPTEWIRVSISGEVHYQLDDDKGLPFNGTTIFENDGSYYAHESKVTGPFDDFYYGSLKEEPTLVNTSGTINTMQTEEPYVKGTLKAFENDRMIAQLVECDVDVLGNILTDEEKRIFTIPSSYNINDVKVCYVPIDSDAITDYIASNIAQYTTTEKFSQTKDGKIVLSKFPYLDPDILSSRAFDFSDGAFYLRWKYSVVYEPVAIFINGIKAINITDYRKGINTRPQFRKSYREDDYQYYVENGNTVAFNKDLSGTILIYYYHFTDRIREQIEMYRSNYSRDDESPEIYSYTLLANIQR